MTEPSDPTTHDPQPTTHVDKDYEIGLLELAIVLAKHKKLVLGFPLVAALLAALVSFIVPNWYIATARVLPPQQQSSSAAMLGLGQLGGLAGLAGASLGIKNPAEFYVGLLRSRTVADALIKRFDLMNLYDIDTMYEARKELERRAKIVASIKDGMITVEVEDKDPKRAANLANAYVEELNKLTRLVALTEASQRRVFFEKELVTAKEHLADAEVNLKRTQESTGLIKLDDQGKAIIENVARLRAQLAVKEVQLTTMRSFATDRNPDLVRIQQELVGLRQQLARLERTPESLTGNIFVPTGKVPEAGLEYLRKIRDVKYHEAIFELLAKQYELAKIDEAKEGSIVQIVDLAVAPDKKSRPYRTLIVAITLLVSAILGVIGAVVNETFERMHSDPNQHKRLQLLWRYLTQRE